MKAQMSQTEFKMLCEVFEQYTDIEIPKFKKDVVFSRLIGRLHYLGLSSFSQYLTRIEKDIDEQLLFVDTLTNHETYFFRGLEQFDFLRQYFLSIHDECLPINAWSAACSTGEEAYSIAMLLSELSPDNRWRVFATDVSERAVKVARKGSYHVTAAQQIPARFMHCYHLKAGKEGKQMLEVSSMISSRINFSVVNLAKSSPTSKPFDLIFLRNVLLYFSDAKRQKILSNLIGRLTTTGLLVLADAEPFDSVQHSMERLAPGIYRPINANIIKKCD